MAEYTIEKINFKLVKNDEIVFTLKNHDECIFQTERKFSISFTDEDNTSLELLKLLVISMCKHNNENLRISKKTDQDYEILLEVSPSSAEMIMKIRENIYHFQEK